MSGIARENFDKLKNITTKKFNELMGSDNNVLIISFVIIFFILFSVLSWIYNTLSNKSKSCNLIQTIYKEGNEYRSTKSLYSSMTSEEKDPELAILKNFHIKTAYNCCCVDGYKNNWVDLCALKKCIFQGARCLDFEIYSYNNEPIIAASTANNNSIKETYNYLLFSKVLQTIIYECFQGGAGSDNAGDPLFLHFRIMSDNKNIYDKMGEYIKSILFNNNLYNKNRLDKYEEDVVLSPILDLREKIIIMVNAKNYINVEQSKLKQFVNLKSGGSNLGLLRYQIVEAGGENNSLLKSQTKKALWIVLPNLNNNTENYDWTKPYLNGCQFIAMKFQHLDTQLIHYNKTIFSGKAIVLKKTSLIERVRSDTNPTSEITLGRNTKVTPEFCSMIGKRFNGDTKQCT